MTQGSKSKPVRRNDVLPSISISDTAINQAPIHASLTESSAGWAAREDRRAERELRADQANLAINYGIRGGR